MDDREYRRLRCRPDGDRARGRTATRWRLHGRKWFTSAVTSPNGADPGAARGQSRRRQRAGALFYVETRDAEGSLDNILVHRLKDKLGTRKVPTAELTLDGTPAFRRWPATRTACATSRRCSTSRAPGTASARCPTCGAAARWRATTRRKRVAFGAPLADKPLHVDTLAGLQARDTRPRFHLAFSAVELLGRDETDGLDAARQETLLRLLTPIAEAHHRQSSRWPCCRSRWRASAGPGYVEDTGPAGAAARRRRCSRSGKAPPTCCRSTLCAHCKSGSALSALQVEVETLASGVRDTTIAGMCQGGAGGAAACAAVDWQQASGDVMEGRRTPLRHDPGRAFALLCCAARRSGPWTTKGSAHVVRCRAVCEKQGRSVLRRRMSAASGVLANDEGP